MEEQGYAIKDNVIYQDKQSSMQQSSTKRTRSKDIRYFFLTDRAQLRIECCPCGKPGSVTVVTSATEMR